MLTALLPAGLFMIWLASKHKGIYEVFFGAQSAAKNAAFQNSILGGIVMPAMAQTQMTSTIEYEAERVAKRDLEINEGNKSVVYLDSRGFPTGGIGHLLTTTDKMFYKVGDTIPQSVRDGWFNADFAKAFKAAKLQARELNKYSVSMIAALTEVNFQLGTGWTSKFANTWALLKAGQDEKAISNLKQSAWYGQTPVRVVNFIEAIQNNYA